ncbi:hypothetical protein [Saccharothrix hoggarensis]|uniref:CDP-glycerol:poly(Glycerophosphate) glycerophosphotransferase n=1 Tax=Saccharothrix hoggarensis TaxID=913853 RepID=A0ABW3QUZ5_9PSEU
MKIDTQGPTFHFDPRLLLVARNLTSLNRIGTVLKALTSTWWSIDVVIDEGSQYADGLDERIRELGFRRIGWEQARAGTWSVILAAHVNGKLAELTGPMLVVAHGAGYNRRVFSSTHDPQSSAGLSCHELVAGGRVFAQVIGLSHEEQRSRLCPAARPKAMLIGDPVFDQMNASRKRRKRFRRIFGVDDRRTLVLVSSTWNGHSLIENHRDLVRRLVAELPRHQYQVVLVLHVNVWTKVTRAGLEMALGHELAAGLLIVPPEGSWQAAAIAADVIIGDHGSVTFYTASVGVPLLLATDGSTEVDPASPIADLRDEADRLDLAADLRVQIDSAVQRRDEDRFAAAADRMFGNQGRSWSTLRDVLHELAGLAPPKEELHMVPIPDPVPIRGAYVSTALRVKTVIDPAPFDTHCEVECFPAVLASSQTRPHSVLLVDTEEVDPRFTENAEIVMNRDAGSLHEARHWFVQGTRDWPGAALLVAVTGEETLMHFVPDGLVLRTAPGVDPVLLAAAVYQWHVDGLGLDDEVELRIGASGAVRATMVRPLLPLRSA